MLAKYGSFKYKNSAYGKIVKPGNANISPSSKLTLLRALVKGVGVGSVGIAGNVVKKIKTNMLSYVSSVGLFVRRGSFKINSSGNISIVGGFVKRLNKFVLSSVSSSGSFSRRASLKYKIYSNVGIAGGAIKGLFISVYGRVGVVGDFIRQASFKRILSSSVGIVGYSFKKLWIYIGDKSLILSSMLKKQSFKEFNRYVSLSGVFSRAVSYNKNVGDKRISSSSILSTIGSFKRSIVGQIQATSLLTHSRGYLRSVGGGVTWVSKFISRMAEKRVGPSGKGGLKYGSFKYGSGRYSGGNWISGGLTDKRTSKFIGNSETQAFGTLGRLGSFFRLIGLGSVSVIGFIAKKSIKSIGDGIVASVGFFKRRAMYKRLPGGGSVSIAGMLRRLYYYFLVTLDNILLPLGVRVTRDSRQDIFPSVKENADNVPGRDGSIRFDSRLGSRVLELDVASPDDIENLEQARREYARHLDPTKREKALVFEHDYKKTYLVKYNGKIAPSQYARWMNFTIPFKMSKPYIIGSYENELHGSGVAINEGNVETDLLIVLSGPLTNPSIKLGENLISYSGTIPINSNVIIDTEKGTAFLNGGTNVLDNVSGDIPYSLPSGETNVVADSRVKLYWRSRWI